MKVTLDKSLGGLGLSITGGSDNQVRANNSNIYITKVTLLLSHITGNSQRHPKIMPNGVAYSDGQLRIGDILLKIDGETVANGRHKKGLTV